MWEITLHVFPNNCLTIIVLPSTISFYTYFYKWVCLFSDSFMTIFDHQQIVNYIRHAESNPAGYLDSTVQIYSEGNLKTLQFYWLPKMFFYNCVRIQLRGFGVRDHIVNFVGRLKGRMLGLCVVTAVTTVSSPHLWVTHSALATGVLSKSLSVSASSSWLPAGSIILSTHILEKSRHQKWVILGFSSYCLNWHCFNQCVFEYVCVFALSWPCW